MNYGELKHNLISKGFAEESDYEELEELGYTYDAINQAINEINDIFPIEAEFDFDIDETDTGILKIDMSDRKGFIGLAETPVWFEKENEEIWRNFTEYDVKKERELYSSSRLAETPTNSRAIRNQKREREGRIRFMKRRPCKNIYIRFSLFGQPTIKCLVGVDLVLRLSC